MQRFLISGVVERGHRSRLPHTSLRLMDQAITTGAPTTRPVSTKPARVLRSERVSASAKTLRHRDPPVWPRSCTVPQHELDRHGYRSRKHYLAKDRQPMGRDDSHFG